MGAFYFMKDELKQKFTADAKKIDLSGQNLTLEDLKEIAALLPQAPLLTTLNLANNNFNFGDISFSTTYEFASAICEHTELKNLYIGQLEAFSVPLEINKIFREYLDKELIIFSNASHDPEPNFRNILNSLLTVIRISNKLNSLRRSMDAYPSLEMFKSILDSLSSQSDTVKFYRLTYSAVYFLAEALADRKINKNPKFKTLVLNEVSFLSKTSQVIAKELSKISKFTDELKFKKSDLKKELVIAIKIMLCNKNCTLKNISFDNCSISPLNTLNLLSILTERPQCNININNNIIIKDDHLIVIDKGSTQEFLNDIAVKLAEKTNWQAIDLAFVEREISADELVKILNYFSKIKNEKGLKLTLPKNFKFDTINEMKAPVTNLNIIKPSLVNKDIYWISEAVQQWKTVTQLELKEMTFDPHVTQDQIKSFAEAISKSQLKALDLSNNKSADKLFTKINSSQLEVVKLTGWELDTREKKEQLENFVANNSALKRLDLTINYVEYLPETKSSVLETVTLARKYRYMCNATDIDSLICFIRKHSSLKNLDLAGWKFKEDEMRYLFRMLRNSCFHLTHLSLDESEHSVPGIPDLLAILKRNEEKSIEKLIETRENITTIIRTIKKTLKTKEDSQTIQEAIKSFQAILPLLQGLTYCPEIEITSGSLSKLVKKIFDAGNKVLQTSDTEINFDLFGFIFDLKNYSNLVPLIISEDEIYTAYANSLISEKSTPEDLTKALNLLADKPKYKSIAYNKYLRKELQKSEVNKHHIVDLYYSTHIKLDADINEKIVPLAIEVDLEKLSELIRLRNNLLEEIKKCKNELSKKITLKNQRLKAQNNTENNSEEDLSSTIQALVTEIEELSKKVAAHHSQMHKHNATIGDHFKEIIDFSYINKDHLKNSNYINAILELGLKEISIIKEYEDRVNTEESKSQVEAISNILLAMNKLTYTRPNPINSQNYYQFYYEKLSLNFRQGKFYEAKCALAECLSHLDLNKNNPEIETKASTITLRFLYGYVPHVIDYETDFTKKLNSLIELNNLVIPYITYLSEEVCVAIQGILIKQLTNDIFLSTLTYDEYTSHIKTLFFDSLIKNANPMFTDATLPPNFDFLLLFTRFCIKGLAEQKFALGNYWQKDRDNLIKDSKDKHALANNILSIMNEYKGINSLKTNKKDREILQQLSVIKEHLLQMNSVQEAKEKAAKKLETLETKDKTKTKAKEAETESNYNQNSNSNSSNINTKAEAPKVGINQFRSKNQQEWDKWCRQLGGEKNAEFHLGKPSEHFFCDLTFQIMDTAAIPDLDTTDPNIGGHSYEEEVIKQYLLGQKDPNTRCIVKSSKKNIKFNKVINEFMEKARKKFEELPAELKNHNAPQTVPIVNTSGITPSAPPREEIMPENSSAQAVPSAPPPDPIRQTVETTPENITYPELQEIAEPYDVTLQEVRLEDIQFLQSLENSYLASNANIASANKVDSAKTNETKSEIPTIKNDPINSNDQLSNSKLVENTKSSPTIKTSYATVSTQLNDADPSPLSSATVPYTMSGQDVIDELENLSPAPEAEPVNFPLAPEDAPTQQKTSTSPEENLIFS